MKLLAALALVSFSATALAQESGITIKNIEYYNSLRWKNESSMEVYVDKTYRLPEESRVKRRQSRCDAVVPYRNFYPYSYSYYARPMPYVYYTNGFNMGYNTVYYYPIHIGRHRRHHR